MKKPCDCCKLYVNHLDERNQNMTCFLRRMTGNFKHNTIVPNTFLRHFTGVLTGTIKLQSPNCCLYDVQVMHRYNKKVLGHGWEAFLDAHHIKENDSLLFRYIEQEGCFVVSIFDSNGCEKMFPCAGIQNTPGFGERSANISSSSQHDTLESSGSERSAECEKGSSHRHGKTERMAVTSSSSDVSGKGISSDSESFELDDLETPAGANYAISSHSCLSEEQKESIIAFIQEIQLEIAVFVAMMRKSHVQRPAPFMTITKDYALAHFPHETTNVTLQTPGSSKKWHPKFYKRTDRSEYVLRGKWLDFVRENHVQEGDICLLYPTPGGRKFTFTIHLLRATGANNAEMVHIKEELAEGEHVSSENGMHEISNESLESQDSDVPHQPPYIVPFRKSSLSRPQKRIIEERVRAIQSQLPVYVAIMCKTSVDYHRCSVLELGLRYASAVDLPARGRTVMLQYMKKIWKTKMVIKRRRHFLSRGWPDFVHDNSLKVGDICLFELKKRESKLTMAVDIIYREQ